ncbi:MAG: helix-turn-helix domain-containing protein, partial [Chloroflexota bacterium]|nr:helix-turn-helix domain-containing protein [Chloroflexota bacterium]
MVGEEVPRLDPAQHEELRTRTRAPSIAPRTRDRLEMIRLADAGWSVPHIARHLGTHEHTVRKYVKAFLAAGFDALPDRPRPGRPPTVTTAHLDALEALLDVGGRTWSLADPRWEVVVQPTSAADLNRIAPWCK